MLFLYIIIPVIIILIITSFFITKKVMKPAVLTYEECLDYEVTHHTFDEETHKKRKVKQFFIHSDYGYNLNCKWFDNKGNKTVVIVHGYTVNNITSLRYVDMYYNDGFNVLLYDHRYHGNSGGTHTSMGYYEKHDLQNIVKWIKEEQQSTYIVVHGESMGASTTLLYGALEDEVDVLVVDCPYADLQDQLYTQIKQVIPFLPKWYMYVFSFLNKLLFGFYYKQVSPKEVISNVNCPILYIHGDSDTLINMSHSNTLHNITKTRSKLIITNNADHAMSVIIDKDTYTQNVMSFIRQTNKGEEDIENTNIKEQN